MKKLLIILMSLGTLLLAFACSSPQTEEREVNYDENKVPSYTLPDPLVAADGSRISDAAAWTGKRRGEVLKLFQEQMYGRSPGKPDGISSRTIDSTLVLDGLAVRKQVVLTVEQNGKTLDIGVLLYLPAAATGPSPAFMGLNFNGNQSITDDPGLVLNANWMRPNEERGVVDNRATEKSRGHAMSRWQVEKIVKRGYAVVTAYYGDIDPDYDDGFQNGIHPLFYMQGQTKPAADEWGSIGAWAWGLSRMLDYLETDAGVAQDRVAVLGHSRLGKTALWAGAQDKRFAGVISNNSGCGGAALSRRCFGETVAIINTSFPHWFCGNFKQYNNNEDALPLDQHELIALVAPRPVYVASAVEDRWADPRGEFLSLKNASPVYELFGVKPVTSDWPAVDHPLTGRMSYHVRSGGHNVTDYDWDQYLNWADNNIPVN